MFFKLIRRGEGWGGGGILLHEEKYTVRLPIRVIRAVIFFISRLLPLRATAEIL